VFSGHRFVSAFGHIRMSAIERRRQAGDSWTGKKHDAHRVTTTDSSLLPACAELMKPNEAKWK
jgi:hypothetical protein